MYLFAVYNDYKFNYKSIIFYNEDVVLADIKLYLKSKKFKINVFNYYAYSDLNFE